MYFAFIKKIINQLDLVQIIAEPFVFSQEIVTLIMKMICSWLFLFYFPLSHPKCFFRFVTFY